MHQQLYRSFSDRTGRSWRVSEFFATQIARSIAAASGDATAPVPLLFMSGSERRWVAHAPAHWWDVSEERLIALLDEARVLPLWFASFSGTADA